MDILNFRILVISVILLTHYTTAIEFDDGCFLEEPASLQVAFVMDRTGTFLNKPSGGGLSFFEEFAALVPQLMTEIDKDYPGTQFALTVHADWPKSAKPPTSGQILHNEPEGCYTRTTKFTTDRELLKRDLNGVKKLGSGKEENGLSALAFTAADKMLGWVRNETFPNGKLVRRVIILVTDEDDKLKLNNTGNRGEFKGDGTDTCTLSKPPTHKKLKEVFEKYQMTVITLLAENSIRKNLTDLYNEHFKKIGSKTKYCTRAFALVKGRILFTDEELKAKGAGDFWSGDNFEKEAEEMESSANEKAPLEGKAAEIEELSATRAKAGNYDDLIKYVKGCLKETDSNACIFGDPPGFNTLGF